MALLEYLSFDEIEALFVANFIVPERRERALFELKSKKKRRNFFSELYGGSAQLDQRFISEIVRIDPRNEREILSNILNKKYAEKKCYMMSYMPEIDRRFVSLYDGLSNLLTCPMVSVLVCGTTLALLRGEANTSAQPLLLLEKRKS